jgi:hypothetical protein
MIRWGLVIFCFSSYVLAYTYTNSNSGKNVKWKKRNSQVLVHVDTNSDYFSPSEILSIFSESLTSWNNSMPYSLVQTTNPGTNHDASLVFTSDPRYFSNGVVAVTKVSFQESSGVVYDASILVNESINQQSLLTSHKSLSSGGFAYLGDVLTHELGHLLGLGHSEVYNSSMVFSLFKNQHEIESDDKHAIMNLYDVSQTSNKIYGKVTGGGGNPVYGAHVQLISLKKNNIVSGVFTGVEGNFSFANLDADDQYILYMEKIKHLDALDDNLAKSTSRYCNSQSFVPSFLSSCDSSKKGESVIFDFSESRNINVGNFTIRCSNQVKADYLYEKSQSQSYELDMIRTRATHTGYFTENQIKGISPIIDRYHLDLRSIPMDDFLSNKLRLNFMGNKLGSMFLADIKVKNLETNIEQTYSFSSDAVTGRVNSELQIELPLSLIEGENNFEISIVPSIMTESQKEEIFAIPSLMGKGLSLYHITAQILLDDLPLVVDQFYRDNSSCREGTVSHKIIEGASSFGDAAPVNPEAFSCASVSTDNNHNGFFSILLGFSIIILGFFITASVDKVLSK